MKLPEGFNWFLILVTVVVVALVLVANVYVLIHFQHPEDRNQAWFPKIVVVISLTLAVVSVLMFPLDVANRAACNAKLAESACTLTLPMKQLWFAVYIINLVFVWAIIPFTMFYYEADSDFSFFQRVKSAFYWVLAAALVLGLSLGVAYGLAGYVRYPTQRLDSGVLGMDQLLSYAGGCIKPGQEFATNITAVSSTLCDGINGKYRSSDWKLRVSFPVYIMAIQSIIGWILFMIFAGVGVLAAPIDWIFQFIGRPKAIISRSEYMQRARVLAQRAKQIKDMGLALRKQDRESGKTRKWRSQFKNLQREVLSLEEDEEALDRVFPQGADGDVKFVTYQLGFYLIGLLGVVGLVVSLLWIVHIVVYMLPPVPVSPLLNKVFIKLDDVFPLFGVAAFSLFCLYLMVVAIKGNFMLGLNFIFISLYPMRVGATMMSSFLINCGVILTMSAAVIQFCSQAFAVYAVNTAIADIFGNQVSYLQGIQWIYNKNIFLYVLLGMSGLSVVFLVIRGPRQWKRRKVEDAYKY